MLQLFRRSFPERPAFDAAVSHALLEAVAAGRSPATLRLHDPGEALAFSVLDRTRPGFARAVEAARQQGFEPILRLAGGRAAVFHRGTLGLAWSVPCPDPRRGIHERFEALARIAAAALRRVGVDARIGALPGEYCPGDYSVNAGGRVKLVGIGQRVVRGAAHLGAVLVLRDAERVRQVLVPVYRELGLAFDPETVGSVEQVQGAGAAAALEEALRAEFGGRQRLVETELGEAERARAAGLEAGHRLDPELQRAARGVEESLHDGNALGPAAR